MKCVGYMIFSKITKSSSYSSLTISIPGVELVYET
jgi:hypothetical protein